MQIFDLLARRRFQMIQLLHVHWRLLRNAQMMEGWNNVTQ
jgi:hypothetical protein